MISKFLRQLQRIAAISAALMVGATSHASCNGTLFLTFDTGHMEPASAIADILAKHQIKATFFLANEKTKSGGWTLDDEQKPFWQRLAREGHAFGSHTWNHHYFRGDVGVDQVRLIPWGQAADKGRTLDAASVCEEIKKPDTRFREMTGRNFDPIWRAPGGKTSPRYTAMVAACGYRHVGWADAGFLGDELSSKTHPNEALIKRAVAGLRDGDVMMAHLGIWSRAEPFWPALDPLIGALKAKGFCFATIAEQSKRADTAGKGR